MHDCAGQGKSMNTRAMNWETEVPDRNFRIQHTLTDFSYSSFHFPGLSSSVLSKWPCIVSSSHFYRHSSDKDQVDEWE